VAGKTVCEGNELLLLGEGFVTATGQCS
jgi:hypothetical protein